MRKISREKRKASPAAIAVARVSTAIRKLFNPTGSGAGSDCFRHVQLGHALLRDFGFDTQRVVGFAAWRVGPGAADVIFRMPRTRGFLVSGGKSGSAYHAWLSCSGFVVDFTTYQFRVQAQRLDAADRGHTKVVWCPDFLFMPQGQLRSLKDVRQGMLEEAACYVPHPELEPLLRSNFVADAAALQRARVLLALPAVREERREAPQPERSQFESDAPAP